MTVTVTQETASPLPPPNEATAHEEVYERAETVWTRGPDSAPNIAKVVSQSVRGKGGRVAIVDGCRTPFAKAGTDLRDVTSNFFPHG